MMITLNGFSKGVKSLEQSLEQQVISSIDRNIGYFMVEQKINREQMAALMGMSANTLRWKREGRSEWLLSEVIALSKLTGKSIGELSGLQTAVI